MTHHFLLQLAVILIAAKAGGEICERYLKQPAVLGEILGGVLVGQSVLGWVQGDNAVLGQIAEIGAVLLLFVVGLESDVDELFGVGWAALWVACAGVALTLGLGYGTLYLLGRQSIEAAFVAAISATSVGITARVFSDLKALHTKEARIVLGAAVADDVIGLIVVAAVGGLAVTKVVSAVAIGKMIGLAMLFLVGAVLIGLRATPVLLHWARKMKSRAAMPSVAVIFCLILATLAEAAQLAPIVGAFAAGLVLAKTEHKIHFEDKVRSVADIFVPVFFVLMGARMDLRSFNFMTAGGRATLAIGALLLVVVVLGKVIAGLTVPARKARRWIVATGMIPRGEVTLIAASIGLGAKVLGPSLYAAIILVVILTTLITPPLLKFAINERRQGASPHS